MAKDRAPDTWAPVPTRSQDGGVRSGRARKEKEDNQKVKIAFEKKELLRMVNQVKEEIAQHERTAAEIEEKLGKLAKAAFAELLKVKELKAVIENLREESPLPRPEKSASGDDSQRPSDKLALDQKLERLLAIQKLLEAASASRLKKGTPETSPRPASSEKKKILVVDDDPTTVKIIVHFLERENFAVIVSHSGTEGLEKAFQEKPDLILLDIMMPDLDGFQFLSIFQKDELNARVPVIILSSLAEEADVLKGLQTGAADYIVKPFSPQVLLAKIKKSLNSNP